MADVLPLRITEVENPITHPQRDNQDYALLIDRDELARRLSIGVSTLDRLRAAGKIGPRAIKCGGVRFLLAEVVAWISTPDAAGEPYDAKTWPSIWEAMQRQRSR